MAYNQSKIKSFRRCQKQYAFRYDYAPAGQELVRRVSSRPLRLGSWMHALQEQHHLLWAGEKDKDTGGPPSWQMTHKQLTEGYNQLFLEEREELGDLPTDALRLWRSYLKFWGKTEEKYRVAKLPDGRPAVEFVVEADLGRFGVHEAFKGRIDLMVEDMEYGGYWIWDSKWVKSIPSDDERMMSPQSLLYPWAVSRQFGIEVNGFVYNYGRTKPPTIPRVLKRPAGQLSMAQNMDTDFNTYVQAIKDHHKDRWRVYAKTVYRDKLLALKGRDQLWFRRERIPIDKGRVQQSLREFIISIKQVERRAKPGAAPRTYIYSCHFPQAGCDYHDLCVAEFNGLNIDPLIKANYEYVPERYEEKEEDLLRG